ncbi:hypothetical protein Poli38472_007465 [Pythium oligandrum]|uniref:Uncharacterized protein n=1 Tax=Pythium oligandrum TaxID=41045 RepID=A0A8K1CT31_PYTOL|nr:hypothetical protein Poli38472_007465 [Pythium oligandrum]|eukprot:TMW67793.1 hypothetical protein Poli38472_007465 [Pythium oligandrum]
MKKLLGGLFQKQRDAHGPPATTPTHGAASPSPVPSTAASTASSTPANSKQRVWSPSGHHGEPSHKTGVRSSWETFFASSVRTTPPPSSSASANSSTQRVVQPAKVFNQNLEVLMRETAAKIKLVINKIVHEADFQDEFAQLCGFVNLAADKLLENGDCSVVLLRNYFVSPAGTALCEQTAFPSLVLDFVDKVRIHVIKLELKQLHASDSKGAQSESLPCPISASDLERPIRFLMSCVQAIASDNSLMDMFRCELPNLVYLVTEDYPASMVYLRDMACQALATIPDKNFTAALVWYLKDCSMVTKSVRMMVKYSEADIVSTNTAADALQVLASATKSPVFDASTTDQAPIAAAVSDALGLNTDSSEQVSEVTTVEAEVDGDADASPKATRHYVLTHYDPLPGLKAMVYTLQKTCRFSLALLGEFQSSGGYDLISFLVKAASERQLLPLIDLFTLLLPLGTGFSGVCGDGQNMATIVSCGARNIGAFLSMRDMVLECMSELKSPALNDEEKAHRELLLLQLLTTILQVYTSAYENFLCLEQKTQALAMILSKFPSIPFYDAQVIILRVVEYVCVAARADFPLPVEILALLSSQFVEFSMAETNELVEMLGHNSSESVAPQYGDSRALLVCECVIKILQNSAVLGFIDELSSFGLLERGIYMSIVKISSSLSACTNVDDKQRHLEVFSSRLSKWSALACLMLKNNDHLAAEFRALQIHNSIYVIAEAMLLTEEVVTSPKSVDPTRAQLSSSPSVFSILVELATFSENDQKLQSEDETVKKTAQVLQTGVEGDVTKILELVHANRGCIARQWYLLDVLKLMLKGRVLAWDAWRICQGHEMLVSLLSSFHHLDDSQDTDKFQFMDKILLMFCTILDSHHGDDANRRYFVREVGYSTIASCLANSGVLVTEHLEAVLNRLFELITGQDPPRNKIRNPHAVEVLFCLVPTLPVRQAEAVLLRLMAKIVSNDDISYSKKRQITSLVEAGAFKWLSQSPIIAILVDDSSPLQSSLMNLVIELSAEELSTTHLRECLRVIANSMPRLLGSQARSISPDGRRKSKIDTEEPGLRMLTRLVNGCTVPRIAVGTNVAAQMTSGYVHIVNSCDRVWPPSNGYSFACWLRFPPPKKQHEIAPAVRTDASTTSVALCEGTLLIKLDGDDAAVEDSYCVLIGAELTQFESADAARRSMNPTHTFMVTAVAQADELQFFVWCHEKRYVARTTNAENTAVWLRALQQSEGISRRTVKHKVTADGASDEEVLFVQDEGEDMGVDTEAGLDGFVCLLSVYQLESAGCFIRIYFDQSTGCLRVDTGSVTTGPNMNPHPKRTTALFKNVNLELLCASVGHEAEKKEKPTQWHHLALAHRKSALGSSQLTLFIDGAEVTTKKLSYPSAPALGTLQAFIGKDIQVCGKYQALPWKVGPTWFTEDVLSSSAVACMFLLGPSFSGQYSGHAYRSVGDWPEAIATAQLDRATKRRVEVGRAARRTQLVKLAKASRRNWYDNGNLPGPVGHDEVVGSKPEPTEAARIPESRRKPMKFEDFSLFIDVECAMSTFGIEILEVLASFKLDEDSILFSVNTKLSAHQASSSATQVHTVGTEHSSPLDFPKMVPSLGGLMQLLYPLLENAWESNELKTVLNILIKCVRRNPSCLAECFETNGYSLITGIVCSRIHLIDQSVLAVILRLAISGKGLSNSAYNDHSVEAVPTLVLIVDATALAQVVLSQQFRLALPPQLQLRLLVALRATIDPGNPNAFFNARQLRRAKLLQWILLFIADVGSHPFSLDEESQMDLRSCFPVFEMEDWNAILQQLLSLLITFLHLENHVDDVSTLSECLILSMAGQGPFTTANPFRVIVLQVLLQELEDAAGKNSDGARNLASTLVDAVLVKAGLLGTKKKKEKGEGMSLSSITAPTSTQVSAGALSSGDGFDVVLMDIIRRVDQSRFSSLEALLSTRILFSLAQDYSGFAHYFLQTPSCVSRFKRVLQAYSTSSNFYIPLLAYVSNIQIKDTKYNDPVTDTHGSKQFALPTPNPFVHLERAYIDSVWEIMGNLLLRNCQLESELANQVLTVVLTQLSFQIEVSEAFFATLCHSSSTVLRIFVQCLLSRAPSEVPNDPNRSSNREGEASRFNSSMLDQMLSFLRKGLTFDMDLYNARAAACLDVLRIFISRSLFEKDEVSMYLMFILECMDDEISRHPERMVLMSDGQKCWLALLVHVVKSTKALSDNCTFVVVRSLCTLCVAISRYLVDTSKHQGATSSEESIPTSAHTCFGFDVLVFFLSTVRKCAEPRIGQVVGSDDQQFFYGCLVYCVQVALLTELNGCHKFTSPSQHLLDSLVKLKHLLLQQTKVSGVIVCGPGIHHGGELESGSSTRTVTGAQITRMRSLNTSGHKEFGIGAESDRSFVLSLAAELFRWLVDDAENVRYSSIMVWQFLIQQRMNVLKELLIVEPKVSLLQNIAAKQKEVIDVYHGGFELLLQIVPPRLDSSGAASRVNSGELTSSHESWLQFHIWLTENHDLLKDLILTRTEPIFQHMLDVLLSCVCIRKVNINSSSASRVMGQNELTINLDFPPYEVPSSAVVDISDETDAATRFATKKALLRLTHTQASTIEALRDAQLRWREASARLLHTRTLWHMGGWNEALKSSIFTPSEPRTSSASEPFYMQRSVFQQNANRYRLDFTEGPQRMRLRLVRSYALISNPEDETVQKTDHEMPSSPGDPVPTDPSEHRVGFNVASKVFAEFVFTKSVGVKDMKEGEDGEFWIEELIAKSSSDIIRGILSAARQVDPGQQVAHLARVIFGQFLEGDRAEQLGVSSIVAEDISRAIEAAEETGNEISATLFDLAVLETVQSVLRTPMQSIIRTKVGETSTRDSDDEEEDGTASSHGHVVSDSEESDPEDYASGPRTNSAKKIETTDTDVRTSSGKQVAKGQDDPKGLTINKATKEPEEKLFDSSTDYVYGGVARFLHREDYPPSRCYNASYVAGMAKTMGVLLVCRNAIYFIGGYEKLYNEAESASANAATSSTANPSSLQGINSNPLSPTKTTSKRKAKDVIRSTFADIGISFPSSKGLETQLFSVVVRTRPDDETNDPTPGAHQETGLPNKRWSLKYVNVKQFYRVRYQLRPIAIELFDTFGSTFFLQFETSAEREELVKLLFQMPIVNSVFWNPVLRSSALSLSLKRMRHAMTKRWIKGQVSNFEYLMNLNTLAGRSFNDLTQYPIFPWVLSDYKSEFIDLDQESTFRDLSKPMGALGENRAALFRERFAAMNHDMPHGPMDTPAFHYGTHYSCSAYVINYLIRMEPFAKLARDLQSGSFDHADRLFRSIPSSWDSASSENLQDVRELIPEFFFLPEFLYNANNFDLGTTQSGEVVSHVKLPPWAHGDPREFIRLHRRALESKYVSEHLHLWIDLIFGYKQTGQEALDAQNVFMHFTYEGAVDIDAIDDPVWRNAMLAQIENFGQTPSKLFSSPHPARKVPALSASLPAVSPPTSTSSAPPISAPQNEATSSNIEAFIKWHTALAPPLVSIGKDYVFLRKQPTIHALEGEAVGDVKISNDKVLCRPKGATFVPPRCSKYLEWGSADGTMKLRVHQSSTRHREANKIVGVIEEAHHSKANCAAFSEDGVVLVTGGDDAVVNVLECMKVQGQRMFKQVTKLVGHDDVVTSVAIDKEFNLIASGSHDCCVILWDLRTKTFLRELGGHNGPVVHVGINGANGNVLTGTASEIRLWSINGDLLAATTAPSVGLSTITAAISTQCETWQNGVVVVTGHSNGTIALWGLSYPADIANERRQKPEADAHLETTNASEDGSIKPTVHIGIRRRGSSNALSPATHHDGSPTLLKAVPSCHLFVMKLLMDHRAAVTALTMGPDQRQFASADADGNCIRWIDDSISTGII